jgi:hypothetical protein
VIRGRERARGAISTASIHACSTREFVRWATSLVALLVLAAHAACAPSRSAGEAAAPQLVEGVLTIIVGDPAPPATTGQVIATVTQPDGRRWQIVPDSTAPVEAGSLRRFDRAWVRVVGRTVAGDTMRLWISRIDSIPPRRS